MKLLVLLGLLLICGCSLSLTRDQLINELSGEGFTLIKDNHNLTFKKEVFNESVDIIWASVIVKDGIVTELFYDSINITGFEECAGAGYEVLYPDCIGCVPYCDTPDGRRFEQVQ